MNYDSLKRQWASRRARIRKLYDKGLSITAIAAKLKLSKPRVHQIVNGK